MKRAASQNASAADSRRAADRLRQATDPLGGLQQQDASGRLSSMAQTAEQLAARQKQQADHVRDLMAQQKAARDSGKTTTYPSPKEMDKMVNDRQQVSDDLARLTQQMRGAARELAPTQPAASTKLRSALEGMDENDLGTRMQRSSDQLRSGEFYDSAEAALTSDLQKLGRKSATLLTPWATLSTNPKMPRSTAPWTIYPVCATNSAASGARPDQNRAGQQAVRPASSRASARGSGANGQRPTRSSRPDKEARRQGAIGNRLAGPVGNGGGGNRQGNIDDNYDTGNTRISGRAVAPQQGPNPADTQRQIDQGLNLLNQVRAVVQDSPEARRSCSR